ncbi:MAG TPA: efflux RND transporter periplasmic adaptor subunit [Anaerolineaceae bacterium]|nr:efflux RND transporter periplasmic adaptor subunit [Anaerolineaceae bacterium]
MNKKMHFIPVVVLVLAGIFIGGYYLLRPDVSESRTLSGTIEALEVRIAPELGGRVVEVFAGEGQMVQAADVLIRLDDSLLQAQRVQAENTWQAALSSAEAARASLALLQAGPSDGQLAVAQAGVNLAQVSYDAARLAYEDLPGAMQDTAGGRELKAKMDAAEASLDSARAQYNLLAVGARPEQVDAARAQVEAAENQAAAAEAALAVLDVQIQKLTLTAPADGVVLTRIVEPGELAVMGSTMLVLARLDPLTLTVYVPEDEYGTLLLGQELEVTVDSFPGEVFPGKVTHIADQAEYTPRNIQTIKSRKVTVFAVQLTLSNPDGRLKPGMPASVSLHLPGK